MRRVRNPFICGGPVPHTHFIGREDIVNNCYNWLASWLRTSIAISGEHGIGKTSLLHYVRHIAQEEGWGSEHAQLLFTMVYCQDIKPFTPTNFWRRVLDSLKQEVDKPVLNQEIADLLEEPALDNIRLQPLFSKLKQHQFSLILLLDSFASIVDAFSGEPSMVSGFLAGLRSLSIQADLPLTLITTTREPLGVLCADIVKDYPASHFYNGFAFQSLGPFSQVEIEALLDQAQDEAGQKFDDSFREFLFHIAGAHPALLQMAGFHLFKAYHKDGLTKEVRKKVIKDFEGAAENYFSQFWDNSSPLERTLFILIILAQLREKTTLQMDLTREEMYDLFNKYERDLIQLVNRGLVHRKQETYQIASVVFAQWIVRKIAAEGEALFVKHGQAIRDEALRLAWQSLITLASQLTLDPAIPMLVPRAPQPSDRDVPIPARYKLQGELGRGASSVVFKAYDTRLDRTVAIKLLQSHLMTDLEADRERLLKEARAASKLDHPHIVTIYDATEAGDGICLVMEYAEGQTLADLLREKERLPLEKIAALVEQAADALDYAHRRGVIHRDIKPANLMITRDGVLKLADFGIAKRVDAPQTTEDGEFKGTVTYMSPEQVRQQPLDGRSDLFSLATVAFEMLSGHLPWPSTNVFDIIDNIRDAQFRPLTDFQVTGAAILDPIFRKALAADPDGRYQSGKDFVNVLRKAAEYFTADGTDIDVLGTGKRWAVLVGVNTYEDETHYGRLEVCVKDAKAISEQLATSGFNPDQVRLLTDEAQKLPDKENILETLKATAESTKPDDLLLFYYSGHGDEVDGKSYLVARNGRRTILSDSAVPVSRIKEMMEAAPARAKIIILDACHSGADIKGRKGLAPMPREFIRRVFEQAKGLAIMASCQQGQFSYEWKVQECSVFTHFLLEALRGLADRDEKGFVTVQDVNRHVADGVQKWAGSNNVSQTPTLQYTVSGDIILAVYR
jgi:serine/threonine protein kinase/Cdc6-like AAA superfamily ATPase